MKKLFIACLALVAAMTAQAQRENGIFNHLSVGLNAGTPGVGFDIAMPITEHFSIRGGYTLIPDVKYNTTLNMNYGAWNSISQAAGGTGIIIPNQVDVESTVGMGHVKALLDIFPVKRSSFHFTVGAYFGNNEDVITVKNTTPLTGVNAANEVINAYNNATGQENPLIGLELGDYLLTPDNQGYVKADFRVKKVKPYVGIGFGRAVPHKGVGLMLEAGAMLWDKPGIYCNDHILQENDFDGEAKDVLRTTSKISVYPVLNLRLSFKAY